ncbi:LacI family transcriptional regulator [Cellulomonas sp. WB94]|nr:LacI family transcriptional regulator [Cellulomonas sp. WB94]
MNPGISDVARAAGVSTASVSRALRGLPGVTEATRARVLETAHALGYVASPSAASLASGRMRTVGILTPWVDHFFHAAVIEGAERALRPLGFDALLHTFDANRGRPRRALDAVALHRRVDGILVVGVALGPDEIAAIDAVGVPVVYVGSGAPGSVLVRIDDEATARAATAHLVGLGHRVVGHLAASWDDGLPDDVRHAAPAWRRLRGWRETLREAGLDAVEDLVVTGPDGVAGGRASAAQLLDRRPDVTALFAATDELAMGAVLAARERGLHVPGDLSVIGVDGHPLGELVSLTTMAQPAVEQGAAAARALLDVVVGLPVDDDIVFPTRLEDRGSTAPPRLVPR